MGLKEANQVNFKVTFSYVELSLNTSNIYNYLVIIKVFD